MLLTALIGHTTIAHTMLFDERSIKQIDTERMKERSHKKLKEGFDEMLSDIAKGSCTTLLLICVFLRLAFGNQ